MPKGGNRNHKKNCQCLPCQRKEIVEKTGAAKVLFSFRIYPEYLEEFKQSAIKQGCSPSVLIQALIVNYLGKDEAYL